MLPNNCFATGDLPFLVWRAYKPWQWNSPLYSRCSILTLLWLLWIYTGHGTNSRPHLDYWMHALGVVKSLLATNCLSLEFLSSFCLVISSIWIPFTPVENNAIAYRTAGNFHGEKFSRINQKQDFCGRNFADLPKPWKISWVNFSLKMFNRWKSHKFWPSKITRYTVYIACGCPLIAYSGVSSIDYTRVGLLSFFSSIIL